MPYFLKTTGSTNDINHQYHQSQGGDRDDSDQRYRFGSSYCWDDVVQRHAYRRECLIRVACGISSL